MQTQHEVYSVSVHHRSPVMKQDALDSTTIPVGDWQAIAYWLDEHGYIDTDYRIEVRVNEVSVEVASC